MIDVSGDETKGSILYSNKDAGNTVVTNYDLLFLSMTDGSVIRQLKVSSINFNPLKKAFLFFYNSKIYFFAYEEVNEKIAFAIFNEATISTQPIGTSLSLGYFQNTWQN